MYILLNISRSKGNQTMKFGQLREYNMRNKFLEKSYTKCSGEAIPRPLVFVFFVCQVEDNWKISKLRYRPISFTDIKLF